MGFVGSESVFVAVEGGEKRLLLIRLMVMLKQVVVLECRLELATT